MIILVMMFHFLLMVKFLQVVVEEMMEALVTLVMLEFINILIQVGLSLGVILMVRLKMIIPRMNMVYLFLQMEKLLR